MLLLTALLAGIASAATAKVSAPTAVNAEDALLSNLDPLPFLFHEAKLFVSSYSGVVTTLSLTNNLGTFALKPIANHSGCAPSPSWLTLDKTNNVLYCVNEGLNVPNGSVASFKIQNNGILKQTVNVTTQAGPVYGTLFGAKPNSKDKTAGTPTLGFAVAHYNNGSISTFTTDTNGTLLVNDFQSWTSKPGPVKDRQSQPHAHQVMQDPSGRFLLVPDLGSDQIMIYTFDAPTLVLKSLGALKVKAGSGPRHIAFSQPALTGGNLTKPLYMYVVAELDSTISAFNVTYPTPGLIAFDPLYVINTFGNAPTPKGAAASEIALSPDGTHILVSNRNDSIFSLPNQNPTNATAEPNDSLVSYKLASNGSLEFAQLWPAGGSFPRDFQLNEKGDLVAVANQMSGSVVVLQRDTQAGLVWNEIAAVQGLGQVTSLVWYGESA